MSASPVVIRCNGRRPRVGACALGGEGGDQPDSQFDCLPTRSRVADKVDLDPPPLSDPEGLRHRSRAARKDRRCGSEMTSCRRSGGGQGLPMAPSHREPIEELFESSAGCRGIAAG